MIFLKGFFKKNIPPLFTTFFCLAIFGSLFILLGLDRQIFTYASRLILFFLFLYLSIQAIHYKKEQSVQEQFVQAEKRIKELENDRLEERAAIEEYFLMWVHQMKTPITAASLLANDQDHDANERCTQIRLELIRIDDYTNMALNYLKVINPSTDLNFETVLLDDLLKPLLQRYSVLFIHNHIQLHYTPILYAVLTDPKWTSIVIEQLLTNSIKYAKNKDITISYDEKEQKLTICDTGIGIREEDIPRIFQKGFSGFNGKFNQKSTGLGLFLVQTITERLHHRIEVQSVLSKETQFHIFF